MAYSLGQQADAWNAIAQGDRAKFAEVRREFQRLLHRELIGMTSSSGFRVLCGIAARTLSYGKYAESISAEQFCRGMRDPFNANEYRTDGQGRIIFRGCNIAKEDTVRAAIRELEDASLITKWVAPRSGWPHTYMPFSEDWLAELLVREGGVLPEHYPYLIPGEKLTHADAPFEFESLGEDGSALVQELGSRLRPVGRSQRLSAGTFRRMTVREVLDGRGRPPPEFWRQGTH